MPAITMREVIAELVAGARIVVADDNNYELQYPGTPIPGHMLTHELVRGGWVQGNPNGGSYRLSDAGRLAYMRSTDELGDGALLAPNACVPAAGEAQQYRCVKCGYKGPQQINHQRPNGTGECGYIAHVADGVKVVESQTKPPADADGGPHG